MSTQSRQRRREGGSHRRLRLASNEFQPVESQSLVEICGRYWTKCGYCKPDTKTSLSYGLLAKRLTCADYQELIDRGWRRSGTFVYKPVMHETCCPQYTIRLDVSNFKPSKAQRHVLNRVRRYLEGDPGGGDKKSSSGGAGTTNGRGDQGGSSAGIPKRRDNSSRHGMEGRDGAVLGPNGSHTGSSHGDDRQEGGERLAVLTQLTAKAAVEAVAEDPNLAGMDLAPEWESNLEKWAQFKKYSSDLETIDCWQLVRCRRCKWSKVKPIRGKSCVLPGGGFCSTVALNMASAARKRGWRSTGGAGGAVAIAEAIVERIRLRLLGARGDAGALHSGSVIVASNGFINLAMDVVEALMAANSDSPAETTESAASLGRSGGESGTAAADADAASSSNGLSGSGLFSLPRLDPASYPHRLTVSTGPARVTEEVFCLYRKYQIGVHGDNPSEVTLDQFRRFLVDSPLIRQHQEDQTGTKTATASSSRRSTSYPTPYRRRSGGGPPRVGDDRIEVQLGADDERLNEETQGRDSLTVPYGSYHQLYRIDGTLIAVGVVDILPKCLSSVYCFYDPDYRPLALGKLTALKETEFVREACQLRPNLRDYYMGYYIHSCPKMSYKGSYVPSYLLCPERLSWVPLEFCRPVLDHHKYARLSDLLLPPPPSQTGLDSASDGSGAPWSIFAGGTHTSVDKASHRSRRRVLCGRSAQSSCENREGCKREGEDEDKNEDEDESESATGRRRSSQLSPPSPQVSPPPPPPSKRNLYSSRLSSSGGGVAVTREGNRSVLPTFEAVEEDSGLGLNDIPIMVRSPPYTVSYGALTSRSQSLIRDVLRLYLSTVGPDLARRIILKLHD